MTVWPATATPERIPARPAEHQTGRGTSMRLQVLSARSRDIQEGGKHAEQRWLCLEHWGSLRSLCKFGKKHGELLFLRFESSTNMRWKSLKRNFSWVEEESHSPAQLCIADILLCSLPCSEVLPLDVCLSSLEGYGRWGRTVGSGIHSSGWSYSQNSTQTSPTSYNFRWDLLLPIFIFSNWEVFSSLLWKCTWDFFFLA